jgi:streptogramin lyase
MAAVGRKALRGILLTILVAIASVACSSASAPTSRTMDVPLQSGQQSTLPFDAMNVMSMSTDGHNVLYLGGIRGISSLAPGAARPTALKLRGDLTVLSLAAASDGRLYFVTGDGAVETVAPGSSTPEPLPFGKDGVFSQITVGKDGTAYVGDTRRNKLLKLTPGSSAATELPVAGVKGPGHMVIDAHDNLFVSMMGKIVKIEKSARTTEPVAGVTDHVGGLAVDAAGNLYATDVEANTVSRMPAGGGTWTRLPFSGLQSPTSITVDSAGNVYVINIGRQAVRLAVK